MANNLRKELDETEWEITIIDKDERHRFQSGYLFIPFGVYAKQDVLKPKKDLIPQLTGNFDEWEQRGIFRLVTEVPQKIDFSRSREAGLLGLMQAMGDREMRDGMAPWLK